MKSNFKLYLCDPNKNTECHKGACHTNGGTCETTRYIEFAIDFVQVVKYNPVQIGDTVEFDKEVHYESKTS